MKLKNIKSSTVKLIKLYYILVVVMYFCALMIVSCCAEFFADYSTALYWFGELMNAANRVLFIGVLTCVSVEIFS